MLDIRDMNAVDGVGAIKRRRWKSGGRLTPDDEIAAVNAYINGESVKSLAQRLPLSEQGVYRLIQRVRRRLEDEARQA